MIHANRRIDFILLAVGHTFRVGRFAFPGGWIVAAVVIAIGTAMALRWALAKGADNDAKSVGIMKGAFTEAVGFGVLVLCSKGNEVAYGFAVGLVIGIGLGVAAARALQPPL